MIIGGASAVVNVVANLDTIAAKVLTANFI